MVNWHIWGTDYGKLAYAKQENGEMTSYPYISYGQADQCFLGCEIRRQVMGVKRKTISE